jgi:hypothetical protein
MIPMRVVLNCEGAFPNMDSLGEITAVGRLPQGMQSGKSSIVIEIEVNGVKYHAQTSLAIMVTAMEAFKARELAEATN